MCIEREAAASDAQRIAASLQHPESPVFFAIGAVIPLPYFFGADHLRLSLGLTGIALDLSGGMVARFTARPVTIGMVRQLGWAAVAVGVTSFVGRLLGSSFS